MDYIVIWFILTGGFGYIPPQEVRKTDMSCGLEGQVIGVQLDKTVNPTKLYWPDPSIVDKHCVVDIKERVIGLLEGEYHIATTILGDGSSTPYIGHDPHTTVLWIRRNGIGVTPAKPAGLKIGGQEK